MLVAIAVLVFLAVVLLVWAISTGNKFRRMAVKINEGESGIDVALTKRYDTLTKMLDVCRQYASHEVSTFEKIVELRKGMTMAQRAEASAQMDKLMGQLHVVAENYPALTSVQVFSDLQAGIRDAEAHLQAARRLYNSLVSSFNQMLVSFPSSMIGNNMKLGPREFFEAEAKKREDVSMKL